jgi:hypothetical protein
MTVLDVEVETIDCILQITVNRIHDRGNVRRYFLLRGAFLGFDVEGEGTNHTYIVLYMHGRNIRFELPRDEAKQNVIIHKLNSSLACGQ